MAPVTPLPFDESQPPGGDCCSEPAGSSGDPGGRPLSARAARNPNLTPEELEVAEAEAAEWARICSRC